jgi:carboxymethylenebutenolidase
MNYSWRRLTADKDGIPAWLASPDAPGRHPGILMLHHAPGLTGDYKSNAALLAQRGYTVLVPNLFNMLGFPGDHHMGQGPAIQAKHGDADFLAVVGQAFRFLGERPDTDPDRIGAIGHCLGGRIGIPFAADTPRLRALVLYYATIRDELVTEMRPRHSYETARKVRCATQVVYGGHDHLTPNAIQLKVWQAFLEGGAPLEWHFLSEGNHGFANPDSEWYQPQLAQHAWPLTQAFLDRVLDP